MRLLLSPKVVVLLGCTLATWSWCMYAAGRALIDILSSAAH